MYCICCYEAKLSGEMLMITTLHLRHWVQCIQMMMGTMVLMYLIGTMFKLSFDVYQQIDLLLAFLSEQDCITL